MFHRRRIPASISYYVCSDLGSSAKPLPSPRPARSLQQSPFGNRSAESSRPSLVSGKSGNRGLSPSSLMYYVTMSSTHDTTRHGQRPTAAMRTWHDSFLMYLGGYAHA